MTGHEYGIGLFPQHQRLLRESGITPEVAHQRGYVSVDTKTRLVPLGFTATQRTVPGLLIPIHATDGEIRLHQYRPDRPRLDAAGRERKYETPYRARMGLDVPPRVRAQLGDPVVPLWITEGARKADAAVSAGLCCISLLGVDNWQGTNGSGGKTALGDWRDIALNGRTVYVAYDSDVMTKDAVAGALRRLTAYLVSKNATVRWVYLPAVGGGAKVGLDDYLAAGHTVDELHALARDPETGAPPPTPAPAAPPPEPVPLAAALAVFRRWMHLDDPAPLYALAAALVANRANGDPVWLLIVGAPSTGKTEILSAAARLSWVFPAATITESALLSGTSAKDRARDATGGLLRQVGEFGVILAKDFTSLLAQNRDTRNAALAALREVFDGSWDRPVGTDGGRVLSWKGKAGLIGGVTPAYDRYHAVVASLGDRFLLLRLADTDPGLAGRAALTHRGRESVMRGELREALAGLVTHADTAAVNRPLTDAETDELVRLASFTARARTAVDRDGYTREVTYLPQVEGPGRLVTAYARMLGGLLAIGVDYGPAWSVLGRIAVDCMPAARALAARSVVEAVVPVRTADVAQRAGMTTKGVREHLEDLALLGLLDRTKASTADNAADLWSATALLHDLWPSSTEKYVSEGVGLEEGTAGSGAPPQDRAQTGPLPAPPYVSVPLATCRVCGEPLDPVLDGVHPTCEESE